MKSLLLITSFLIISTASFAEVITIDLPAGNKVVEISRTVHHSGCGDTVNFLDVVKSEEGYVAGLNVSIKHDDEVWINVMPKLLPGPIFTCLAIVKTVTKAKFVHSSLEGEVINVEIPSFMGLNYDIEITDAKLAH